MPQLKLFNWHSRITPLPVVEIFIIVNRHSDTFWANLSFWANQPFKIKICAWKAITVGERHFSPFSNWFPTRHSECNLFLPPFYLLVCYVPCHTHTLRPIFPYFILPSCDPSENIRVTPITESFWISCKFFVLGSERDENLKEYSLGLESNQGA